MKYINTRTFVIGFCLIAVLGGMFMLYNPPPLMSHDEAQKFALGMIGTAGTVGVLAIFFGFIVGFGFIGSISN